MKPSIEESLAKLDTIVRELEGGRLPLDASLARFEEGLRLVGECRTRLAEAEGRIRELLTTGNERGFDAGETPRQSI
ncbi:MAG: exodeoxyribonuclease VII small subunit [Thermoplasmatota archaeon]